MYFLVLSCTHNKSRNLLKGSVMMESNEIIIDGCIDVSENSISVQEFTDKFIEWIESNKWYFGGTTKLYKEE
jgi:hypothetical protein